MLKPDTLWPIERHTLAKHEILRRYLGAWIPILLSNNSKIIYIDGFCGPGQYEDGEPGSPIIALREFLKHSARLTGKAAILHFIDERNDRIDHLEGYLAGFTIPPEIQVTVRLGAFDESFRPLLDGLEAGGFRIAPTFAFIDPFGFSGFPYELICRLLRHPQTEVLINLNVNQINRFLGTPDEKIRAYFVELFGTENVLDIIEKHGDRIPALRLLYQEQLKMCARFVRFFEMRDADNRHIYDLFFASNHPLGHTKIKEAFWKIDPVSGFRFSDATDPRQQIMFQDDPAVQLMIHLDNIFSCQTIDAVDVREYVLDETGFIDSHTTAALKHLEVNGQVEVEPIKKDGKRRKKGSYPAGVILKFK